MNWLALVTIFAPVVLAVIALRAWRFLPGAKCKAVLADTTPREYEQRIAKRNIHFN